MEGEVVVMVCYCCAAAAGDVGAHPLHRWLLFGRHFLDKNYRYLVSDDVTITR
jgi:hypothetical protein